MDVLFDTKSSWQEMRLKALRTLWIYWVFQSFVNYLKLNCFLFKCKLWAFHVLPLGCDMRLPGDYPARYYSLCDIGILAPIFVMVMSFGFMSTMRFGFVSAIEFRLCVDNEFWLCVDRWVLALCRRFSCGLGLDFLVWNGVVIAHNV